MSIYNTPKQIKYAFEHAVKDKIQTSDRVKNGYRKLLKMQGRFKTSLCTQCQRPFDKFLADKQIKNKRENAPICIPCIIGRQRKFLR